MKAVCDIKGEFDDKDVVIIGAGGTLSLYKDKLNKFIIANNVKTIGINNMVGICSPDYHLWTNTKRYIDFGSCISPKSIPIFSHKFSCQFIRRQWDGDFIRVFYSDVKGRKISIGKKYIDGYFRTAGCLAIMIAYIWGAKNIYIAGMDGYTYIGKEDWVVGQHFYGSGMTDSSDWDMEKDKDDIVYRILKNIDSFGVKFKIITPTVFVDFYDKSLLSEK